LSHWRKDESDQKMKIWGILKTTLFSAIAYCATLAIGASEYVVVPHDRATQEGNSYQAEGFETPKTFQVVYGAKNFNGPILITGMAFRLDGGKSGQSFDAIIPRITIRFSTYGRTISSFNPSLYSSNKGTDDTLVFDSQVSWHTTDLPSGTNPFDLSIKFSQPFSYNPANGQLLMSYSVPTGSGTVGFDADTHSFSDATIGWMGFNGGTLTFMPITQFEIVPIPEPGMLALLSFATICLAAYRRK
jgi:hypothetical protein